jgi:diguanylate cyclase (GGDEF)-like protein/PAS domain S-box-containing protein/putative nucleotidyltransferase with HDIG domain
MDNKFNIEKEDLYIKLVEAFPDMLIFLDRKFNVINVNKTAKKLLGKSIVGRKCYSAFQHNNQCEVCPTAKAFETGKIVTIDKYKPLLNRWFEVSSIPIFNNNSEVIAVVEQLKDISKRRETEEALRKSELKFRNYVENSQDIIFTLDEKGVFQYVSPSWKNPLNYTLKEVTGKNFLEFIHPEDKNKSINFLKDIFAKKDPDPIDYRVYHKTDGWRWHRVNGSPITDVDGKELVLGITRDITAIKENEQKIARMTKEFETVFQGTHESMYLVEVVDENTFRYVRANNAQEKVTGLSEDYLAGKTPEEALGRDIGKEITNHYKKCLEKKDTYTYEAKRVFKDTEKIIKTSLNPVVENDEVKYIVGATSDITEQRKAESALRDNLERNKRLVNIFEYRADSAKDILDYGLTQAIEITESKIGYVFFYDKDKKVFELNAWSEEAMAECSVEDVQVIYNLDDTGLWGEAVRQRKAVVVNDFNKFRDLQKGVPEGHVALETFATVPVFYNNEIVAVVGVANKSSGYTENDVTQLTLLSNRLWESVEKHKAEQRVKRERNKLEITLGSIGDGVISTDKEGNIEYINKVAQNITGYTKKEAIGKNFNSVFEIIDEQTGEPNKSPVDIVLQTKEKTDLAENTILVNKIGEKIPIADTATPIYDQEQLIGVVIVFRNVTKERSNLRRIEYLSFHDQLTGLYNRRYFENKLEVFSAKEHLPLSIIMADLNGLKLVNDGFGHHEGDKLLIKTGEILKNNSPRDSIVARIGGDEFVVILPNTDNKMAMEVKSKLENVVEEVLLTPVTLSVAFGISTKIDNTQSIDQTIRVAENNMYREKLYKSPSIRGKTLNTIMSTLYEKSESEEEHSVKVATFAKEIAKAMELNSKIINELQVAGIMHDIGKIAIDQNILEKIEELSEDDWVIIKRHSEVGYRILSSTDDMSTIASYILHHHERVDGKGYPKGLVGDEIPIQSKILAVADAYAAMTSERPYREAYSKEKAIEELVRGAGNQFDKKIVEIFISKVLSNDN